MLISQDKKEYLRSNIAIICCVVIVVLFVCLSVISFISKPDVSFCLDNHFIETNVFKIQYDFKEKTISCGRFENNYCFSVDKVENFRIKSLIEVSCQ